MKFSLQSGYFFSREKGEKGHLKIKLMYIYPTIMAWKPKNTNKLKKRKKWVGFLLDS